MTWFEQLLGTALPAEGEFAAAHGRRLVMQDGLLRDTGVLKPAQQQTSDTFAFKWAQQHTYNSANVQEHTKKWLVSRYGEWNRPEDWKRFGEPPVVLDAGCGAGLTASLLFGDMVNRMHFVGADVSRAVDIAAKAFEGRGWKGSFLQADLLALPFSKACFDFILSEGVLHHTPSTRKALLTLSKHLKPGGVFAFYVYARKGPLREFSDDSIREKLAELAPQEAWEALFPLTRLGKALGELNVTIDVPEDVPLLGITKGKIDLQQLIYWYVCKMYYRPEYSLDEMKSRQF